MIFCNLSIGPFSQTFYFIFLFTVLTISWFRSYDLPCVRICYTVNYAIGNYFYTIAPSQTFFEIWFSFSFSVGLSAFLLLIRPRPCRNAYCGLTKIVMTFSKYSLEPQQIIFKAIRTKSTEWIKCDRNEESKTSWMVFLSSLKSKHKERNDHIVIIAIWLKSWTFSVIKNIITYSRKNINIPHIYIMYVVHLCNSFCDLFNRSEA